MASSCRSLFLRLMSASVTVANHAGKIIREIMKSGELGIVEKGINDLQTEADRSAQRCIVTSLSKQFPKVTIIGEETLEHQDTTDEYVVNLSECEMLNAKCPENLLSLREEDVVIWVDPLDGTAEYTQVCVKKKFNGLNKNQSLLDHVTVLIGVAVHGKAVGGVIHQPYYNYKLQQDYTKLGRTMWGIVGVGGSGIQHQLPPENQKIIATTRSHSNQVINNTISSLNPDRVLKVGGAGHKVLLLIEGKAHAYVFPSKGCKKWDTCAPEALLHAFGGKLTDIHGKEIEYHSKVEHVNATGVLATFSAAVHEWYCANIPEETKDALPAKS